MIGMVIDPRWGLGNSAEIFTTSMVVGAVSALLVLIFLPIFQVIFMMFK